MNKVCMKLHYYSNFSKDKTISILSNVKLNNIIPIPTINPSICTGCWTCKITLWC